MGLVRLATLLLATCYAVPVTSAPGGRENRIWGFVATPAPTAFSRSTPAVTTRPTTPFTTTSRAERAMTVIRPADIGKIMADELYAPMFVQALFLSFSGILVAVALAAVIKFKGEDLQKLLVEEAFQETTALKEKLGAREENTEAGDSSTTIVIGFNNKDNSQNSAAGVASTTSQEAAAVPLEQKQEGAAPVVAEAATTASPSKPKELVSAGSSSRGTADLGDDYDD